MIDFSSPQRQSPIGVLIMFLDTVKDYLRNLWPLLIVAILKFDGVARFWVYIGIGIILVLFAIAAWLRYRNFTFYIDDELDEFILTQGVFAKTKTAIKLNKIQQVNINQSIVQRVIGVHELEVDTAGSADKEVRIKAVSHPLALALKARLLQESRGISEEEAIDISVRDAAPEPYIRISLASLIKTGLTANYVRTIGVILAFIFTIIDALRDIVEVDDGKVEQYFDSGFTIWSSLLLGGLIIGLILLINLVRVVFRYFNYTIIRQNNSLLVSFGLLNTRNIILRPERVQTVTIVQNYFQKKMNLATLRISQAGGEHNVHKQSLEIPGCSSEEKDAILNLLFGTLPTPETELRPNYRKLVFAIFLAIVLPLSGFIALRQYVEMPEEANYAVVAYVAFVLTLLLFSFRNSRLYLADGFAMVRGGAWDVSAEIVDIRKIQAVQTSQLAWHRSAGIGNLSLHTAGGSVYFRLGNYAAIREYVNRWLYKIESSDENWM